MTSDVLIECENVGKKFCRDLRKSLVYAVRDASSDLFGRYSNKNSGNTTPTAPPPLRDGEFWANKDISFQVKRGESLGLIGHNGAGKTTLLKLLSGLIKPNHGKITIRGKLSGLIALGAGFNPILTGRENVYINGLITGFTKAQIAKRLEEIIDFAELQNAIDSPVRNYSSGMQARLAFATAVILAQPDVLLIDEVLAVGDMSFRSKCYRKIAQIAETTAIIVVSHNLHTLESVCQTGLVMQSGKVIGKGSVGDLISQYESEGAGPNEIVADGHFASESRDSGTDLTIRSLYFRDQTLGVVNSPITGNSATLSIEILAKSPASKINASAIIRRLDISEPGIITLQSEREGRFFELPNGVSEIRIHLPIVCLKPGRYSAKIFISEPGLKIMDAVEAFHFTVLRGAECNNSSFYQPRTWQSITNNTLIKDS